MKKTILMIAAALFVLVAVNAQTRKVTPRIRKSGNPAQVIKGKTVPIRSRQADKRKVHSNYSTSRRGTWNDTEKEEETELSIFSAEYRYNEEIKGDFEKWNDRREFEKSADYDDVWHGPIDQRCVESRVASLHRWTWRFCHK